MKRPEGVCKDCWAEYLGAQESGSATTMPRWRPAPKPGPRCVTHDRAHRARQKVRAHDRRVETGFGIPPEVYWALYEFQGGHCAILNCRATGKTRHLAVDHDRRCCPGATSCGKCVRGLLCKRHNLLFGMEGDNPAVFLSMHDYVLVPPYASFLNSQRRAQREQLDRDTRAGRIEQETGPVGADGPDTSAIHPIRWQGIRPVRDDQI